MATYVNDLRLKEITTGDESGTWGTSTNTNLELIAEAFSYGTEVITTNADTHTTTIADGSTDPGRSLYLKYTGTLDSACTITIGPNTVSKVWIIENGTSGSQDIILSQGSGANITIPAGDTKVVYSDGAGAGAAFFDAFASLSVVDLKVQDDLTVTGASTAATYNGIASKTFGTDSIMIGDTTTGTINAADQNTGLGVDVFAALTEGDQNTAIGKGALTATTTGSSNVAVGRHSMFTNTTGLSNVAVGLNSLYYNTEGAYNVAIGQQALTTNTTSSNNTAVGYSALLSNSTGGGNTAVGYETLRNSTAASNTAVGTYSLYTNTSGTYNTAIGVDIPGTALGALGNNTTGSNNTAVGTAALVANTTGDKNVALGDIAGYSNTTGTSNVFIGNGAGYSTTGSGNTFVGGSTSGAYYPAGYLVTTGNNNTILGGYNGNQGGLDIRTLSQNIVISDGVGNPWMWHGSTSQQGLELMNSNADNKNVRIAITQGDGGANTVQVYWNAEFGTTSGVLGAWDRSGNFAAPATTITSSGVWAIYGFIYEGA
jgi:hypothetical protein